MPASYNTDPSSYRDPSGFIFQKDGILYRQVNLSFREDFDHFIKRGCYDKLKEQGLIIGHKTLAENITGSPDHYQTLQPEPIPFISYPYEWSFDMLKDAALLTLRLVREALNYEMILKDATPYNIQYREGKMVFIDTLSFAKYNPEEPWIAYRQFCECFLSPLLLMHYSGQPLQQMLLAWPEGIPIAVTRSLLPRRTRWSIHIYLHIHLHAKLSRKKDEPANSKALFSKKKLLNLLMSLEIAIGKCKAPSQPTAWSDYYSDASGRDDYLEQKNRIISEWLKKMNGIQSAIDMGANRGEFSKLVADRKIPVLATDLDQSSINQLYLDIKSKKERFIQPLVLDISNPSPAMGLQNAERTSFTDRAHFDLVMALAIVHHLAIGKNIPLVRIADIFQQIGKQLIIEFVPKEDEKVKQMLSVKKDIYPGYTETEFEKAFRTYFTIDSKDPIPGSGRTLYLMTKHV
ncbi:MAG TPA: hypothetical protein VLJ68_10000 [Chitinophagaceae bacterium]|nr:hypothetical protein [Chitinophagaceae bacterium]